MIGWNRGNDGRDPNDTEAKVLTEVVRASAPATALPPGLRSPGWGPLLRFVGDPLGLLDECHCLHGDAFTLDIDGYGRFAMLSD